MDLHLRSVRKPTSRLRPSFELGRFGTVLQRVLAVAIYGALETRAERQGFSPRGRRRKSTGSETHEIPSIARPRRHPPNRRRGKDEGRHHHSRHSEGKAAGG